MVHRFSTSMRRIQEVEETLMRFFYDGELCFTRAWYPTALRIQPPAPFDQPFVPALLATTGQGWNSVPLGGSSHGTFDIDYVRIWG